MEKKLIKGVLLTEYVIELKTTDFFFSLSLCLVANFESGLTDLHVVLF